MAGSYIVAVAGGSCSGKTTLANHLHTDLGADVCSVIRQDNYYFTNGGVAPPAVGNFDHPSAIDFELMATHLRALKAGKTIETPDYDFVVHERTSATHRVEPSRVILLDGILILNNPLVRKACDFKIFVECSEDVRLERRTVRDVETRGRTQDSVLKQFTLQVAPMHDAYVEPSKSGADLILNQADTTKIVFENNIEPLSTLLQSIDALAGAS